jgi:anti-sigma regulatory factor (Ser/Thr protein kinase)
MNNDATVLETTTDLGELTRIRKHLRGVCETLEQFRGKGREIGELELAVIEAVTNVIRHSVDDAEHHAISHKITVAGSKLVYAIEHRGQSFDPTSVDVPDSIKPMEGGMGLFIMEQFLDEVSYTQIDKNTQCILLTKCF